MCWRNDVIWRIAQDPDPRKFMTVDSGEYVLAVPDFNRYARRLYDSEATDDSSINSSSSSYSERGKFKKTIMKLSGNVQWLAGLVFERNTHHAGRSFDFKPHYEVVLKNRDHAKPVNGKVEKSSSRLRTSTNVFTALGRFPWFPQPSYPSLCSHLCAS